MRLSTNVESVEDLRAAGQSYYPTQQSIDFVRRLGSAALDGGVACALEGPYGVGKSSLVAFALNQLSSPASSFEPHPAPKLFDTKDDPVRQVQKAGGLLPLALTGSTDSLAARILAALRSFVDQNPNTPEAHAVKARLQSNCRPVRRQAFSGLVSLARSACENRKAGVILVIDEFGRHLERMLELSGERDLHLLQELAEATGRRDASLSLVIVQHYGLDHYSAKMLGDKRAEWEKVRGRFRETVLNNTEKDTAHIVAKTLELLGRPEQKTPKPLTAKTDSPTAKFLRDAEFLTAAAPCRPLHPMTIALLARLARILGQQERTVVGWLTSDMPSGFAVAASKKRRGWVYPDALFDHFFGDALRIPSNPTFARRLAAVHGAAERLGDDLSSEARKLFKILSMLSFCGGQGLAADKQSALACLPVRFPFDSSISELVNKSLLVYRSYRSEYTVWEGSDYDIVGRIDQELRTLSVDIASELNRRSGRNVLAHRHFIVTGNRRTARLTWLNPKHPTPTEDEEPRILIWLSEKPDSRCNLSCDVTACVAVEALEPHVRARAAIQRLLDGDPDLRDDKVAVREMRLRLSYHEAKVSTLLEELLTSSNLRWELGESRFPLMQQAVTEAMDRAYPKAFILHNDMVNRDRLSGTISFALRKLIDALWEYPERENLGIERFPAERIIYESFLKTNGLHRQRASNGTWELTVSGVGLPEGLLSVLKEVQRLFGDGDVPTLLETVVQELRRRPFGVKRYPALLLCILVLLSDKNKHELYEDGQYLPHWGPQTLLRVVKTAKRFAISAASKSPVSQTLMARYHSALTGDATRLADYSPVAVARAALKSHADLSAYARGTGKLPESAQALRRAFRVAKSPGDMLFRAIPGALGYEGVPGRGRRLASYFAQVIAARESLERADDKLLDELGKVFVVVLKCNTLAEGRSKCIDYARNVMSDSRMFHGLSKFAEVVLTSSENEQAWFRSLIDAGLGIARPLSSWTDEYVAQAEFVLRRTLITIQQAGQLLSGLNTTDGEAPFAVFIPDHTTEAQDSPIDEIVSILNGMPKDQRMSAIIDLARTFRDKV